LYELDNDTGGIGELDNLIFERVYELDNGTRGIGELDFFDNRRF
jgi:hypothetical protein